MSASDAEVSSGADETPDLSGPVRVADRTWWVGHHLTGDPFQCHVYLIENGDRSVLFDPGSALTFPHTLRKIERIVPLSHVRYFVCHHQDPDITGALPFIDALVTRPETVIVTHWRAEALIRHYDVRMPFWRIEDHGWTLELEDRVLRFVFTPYLHFAGSFCTFDEKTRTLFSSDIFGGFSDGPTLFASDRNYFDAMRPFHEHYMPSREILAHGVAKLAALPVQQIAPQHGMIIPEALVRPAMDFLGGLDCGLYLLARENSDVQRLTRLNAVLKGITQTMVQTRDFATIAASLLDLAQSMLPVRAIEFFVQEGGLDTVLRMKPADRFRGRPDPGPPAIREILGLDRKRWADRTERPFLTLDRWPDGADAPAEASVEAVLLVPLFETDRQVVAAVAAFHLDRRDFDEEAAEQIVEQMALPLQVAVEREAQFRQIDRDRVAAYERSIRDPLTGMYTRAYMDDAVLRMCRVHDRREMAAVGIVMIDIDFFKSINDRFGHLVGDVVLKRVAIAVMDDIRKADIAVRLGGEEFAVFCPAQSMERLRVLAERLRRRVADLRFDAPLDAETVTVSLGLAIRRRQEPLEAVMERADRALYRAKQAGRNRVVAATDGEVLTLPEPRSAARPAAANRPDGCAAPSSAVGGGRPRPAAPDR